MSRKWWVLVSVACGTFMATLDSSIVNIGLPTLTKELASDLNQVKWIVILYLLVITCLLLPFGRLSDQYGRKKVFQTGFLIFTLGSALCGFSPSLGWLVLARVVQAFGAAMLMANGPAVITAAFPASERGGALGTLAMVVSAGLISGPSIGGFLISHFGWRSIFWINLPIGLLGAMLVQRFVSKQATTLERAPFDWAGAIVQVILLISFIVTFDPPNISVSGGAALLIPRWAMAIVTILLGWVFFKIESSAIAPLFDLALLKDRTFWTANLASFLTFVSFSSVSVMMPFFLEEGLGLPTSTAGLFMTAIPLTILVVAPISGRLSDRLGSRGLSTAGSLIGACALFVMSGLIGQGLHQKASVPSVVLALCSIGLAIGLFQSPNNNAIMSTVPANKLGVASALLATLRNLGMVTGTGMATTLFAWRMEVTGDFIRSMHTTHFVAGVIGFGAMLAALAKRDQRRGYVAQHPALQATQAASQQQKDG